jgi:transglutaminase-like putative cysteine protease
MRVFIRHTTRYDYAPAVGRAALRLKLFPCDFDSQTVQSWRVAVNGVAVERLLVNGFGDAEGIWTSLTPTDHVEVIAEGEVKTEDVAGIVRGIPETARPGVYLRTTPLTKPDPAILALARAAQAETPLASLHAVSNLVRQAVAYTPGSTHATVTAAQAVAQGKGVCQDLAHVFTAAARSLGFPARYVVGYLTQGVGATPDTHAWAEAFVPDLGWVGFDPSNQQCPTDAYVRLASGFDAADGAPIRGSISHGVQESLSARVEITQEGAMIQQQSQ